MYLYRALGTRVTQALDSSVGLLCASSASKAGRGRSSAFSSSEKAERNFIANRQQIGQLRRTELLLYH